MNYYDEIKNELVNNEVYKKVKDYSKNKSDLQTYYNVGKLLVEAQGGKERAKYGDGLIKEYSAKLSKDVDKKYGYRNLYNMRKFYLLFSDNAILHTVCAILTWSHIRELLNFKIDEINYYIKQVETNNLSVRQLKEKIKNKEYQRLDNNTKLKLINKEEIIVSDYIKNPIIIKDKNNINKDTINEKTLQTLILEDIPAFLDELGSGFCFIRNEYKIKIGNTFNYIDLLLFNIEFNCYVVVELKVTELKKEHIGQIEVYMNYIDENIKTVTQDKTIGIIICREDNGYYIKYSSDKRIIGTEYILK